MSVPEASTWVMTVVGFSILVLLCGKRDRPRINKLVLYSQHADQEDVLSVFSITTRCVVSATIEMLKENHHHRYFNNLSRVITGICRITLIVPGAIIMELAPALALDGSDASAPKSVPPKSFSSGQEALRAEGKTCASATSKLR